MRSQSSQNVGELLNVILFHYRAPAGQSCANRGRPPASDPNRRSSDVPTTAPQTRRAGTPRRLRSGLEGTRRCLNRIPDRAGGADGIRTHDLDGADVALSQLSYGPAALRMLCLRLVEPRGVEPPTSRVRF